MLNLLGALHGATKSAAVAQQLGIDEINGAITLVWLNLRYAVIIIFGRRI